MPVKKHIRDNAKSLRKSLTDEGKSLWYDLRDLKARGYKFRKQAPIGRYIVDFVCLKQKLIIELDDIQHAEPDHRLKDKDRDSWLQSQGYTVHRFWNDEIMRTREAVLNEILNALPLEGGGE